MPRDVLTPSEAARIVGVSRQAINDALNRGDLRSLIVQVPSRRILRSDVMAYKKRVMLKRPPPP